MQSFPSNFLLNNDEQAINGFFFIILRTKQNSVILLSIIS